MELNQNEEGIQDLAEGDSILRPARFFHILHREHGFTKLTLFRHSSPLSRYWNNRIQARVRSRTTKGGNENGTF